MRVLSIFAKSVLILILLAVLVLGAFLLVMTIADYNPPEKTVLHIEGHGDTTLPDTMSILTWNLGYCSLGKEADFFLDGGRESRGKSKIIVENHIDNISVFIDSIKPDFVFIQEIDRNATRSFHIDEYKHLENAMKNYVSTFAVNYKTLWVPVPIYKPMGSVLGGLAVFSKYEPYYSVRFSFPGNYSWPVKLFQLDRCYIETKYKLKSNDLVVINLHLSAFDKGGFLRKKQLEYLKKHILNEYEKGNYVLVGGDWNHIFPGVDLKAINENNIPKDVPTLPRNWIPKGWKLAFDSTIPTNRSNNHPYVEGENTVTIIDGFLLSPNIKLLEVRGINLHFNDSDHNPVFLRIALQ